MLKLENGEVLDPIVNRPHWLVGTSPRAMECHIEGNWLLVYRYDGDDIYFVATGTHSDLFR
jgi:mRNA interferase YafQ